MWVRGDNQPIKIIREQFLMECFALLSIYVFKMQYGVYINQTFKH